MSEKPPEQFAAEAIRDSRRTDLKKDGFIPIDIVLLRPAIARAVLRAQAQVWRKAGKRAVDYHREVHADYECGCEGPALNEEFKAEARKASKEGKR